MLVTSHYLRLGISLVWITKLNGQQVNSDETFRQFGFKASNSASCPPIKAKCVLDSYAFAPDQAFGPECWLKKEGTDDYECHFLDDLGMIDCPECFTNVGFCGYSAKDRNSLKPTTSEPIVEPTKEAVVDNPVKVLTACPTENDVCKFDPVDIVSYADPFVPKCWGILNKDYVCARLTEGKCSDGYVSIDNCKKTGQLYSPNNIKPIPSKAYNQEKPQTCPILEDMCNYLGKVPVKIDTEDGPKCWSLTSSGYVCDTGNNGKCNKGFIDVSTCPGGSPKASSIDPKNKLPPYCPDLETSCVYTADQSFRLDDRNPPECWIKTPQGYACKYKRELGGLCPLEAVDTTPCRPGVITDGDHSLTCPKEPVSCTYGEGQVFHINQPNIPECWVPSPSGYLCKYKVEVGGVCPLSSLDISRCGIKSDAPVVPKCPSKNDTCLYNKVERFKADDESGPECWIITPNGSFCRYRKDYKGQCPKGSIDLFNCGLRPIEKSKRVIPCPVQGNKCDNKGTKFTYGDKLLPECWAKLKAGHLCRFKTEVGGKCPTASLDVSGCPLNLPCPKYNSKCKEKKSKKIHTFQGFLTPNCWKETNDPEYYECESKIFFKKDCPQGYLLIDKCNKDKPPPPCPESKATCEHKKLVYPAWDKNAPECWILDKDNKYSCKFKHETKGVCQNSYLNIQDKCVFVKPVVVPPKNPPSVFDLTDAADKGASSINTCPIKGSRCLYNQGGFITLDSPHTPECWINTINGYVCKFKSDMPGLVCPPDSIDLDVCLKLNGESIQGKADAFMPDALYFNPYEGNVSFTTF